MSKSPSYNQWLKSFIRNRVRLALWIALIGNSLYILTAAIYPQQSRSLFLIHSAIELGLLACWVLYKSQIGRTYPDLLILGVIWSLSFGDALGTAFLDESVYYMNMNLTLLAAAVLVPVRWRTHVVAQLATLAYFLGVQVALGWSAASQNALYSRTPTLFWTCAAASTSVYMYERLQRREVNARRKFAAAITKLCELNHQLREANKELQFLASSDGLTQTANRRCFNKYLNQEWRRLSREKAFLSLILCDIDFFKGYNDTYGHQAGDYCLQQVAKAIKSAVKRPADLVARYGGEEFGVILPTTGTQGAVHVAEQIRMAVKAVRITHASSQVNQYVTLSLGVASTIPSHEFSPATLIAAADRALYQAKEQGRDRVILNRCSSQQVSNPIKL